MTLSDATPGEIVKTGTWIYFFAMPPNPKTSRFSVATIPTGDDPGVHLGFVSWYAPWRKYVFRPESDTVFEPVCLGEIAEFLTALNVGRTRLRVPLHRAGPGLRGGQFPPRSEDSPGNVGPEGGALERQQVSPPLCPASSFPEQPEGSTPDRVRQHPALYEAEITDGHFRRTIEFHGKWEARA